MCELTEYAIEQYLDSGIRPNYISDDDYLFGTTAAHVKGDFTARTGKEKWHRGTGAWLSEMIERTVFAVTGQRGVRSHDLRHVGSRVCLNAGQSMEELQGALGHSSMEVTQRYSGRLLSRRNRESAKSVLLAREQAAENLRRKNEQERKVIPMYA